MEAAVPFALLSAVQLVCVVAGLGLAVTGAVGAARRATAVAFVAGGLLIAAAHLLTATMLGDPASDPVAWLRVGGYVVVAVGLGARAGWPGVGSAAPVVPVVAPIGAATTPAVAAAAAALLALAASWRTDRGVRRWLVPAFALAAAAEGVAARAGSSDVAAVTALCLRAGWAVATLAAVAQLARRTVRGKVVGAIVAAVVAIAVGASAVTGTVVSGGFNDDQRDRISSVAAGQVETLDDTAENNARFSLLLADCVSQGLDCVGLLERLRRESVIFTPVFGPDGSVVDPGRLDPAAALALGSSDAVAEVLREGGTVATLLVLPGTPSLLYTVGITATRQSAQTPITGAVAYASAVDAGRLTTDSGRAGYAVTVFDPEGSVLASSLLPSSLQSVRQLLAERDVVSALASGSDGLLVRSTGERPTARFVPLRDARGDLIAAMALSAPSGQLLETQRDVLRTLLATTLLVGLLAAGLALLLARRITAPIERLTATASRIRRGDLTARADVTSSDEVGQLSQAFDAMTASLSTSNDELRRAADQESSLRGRLETIVDSMGDGLLTTDAQDRVTGLNPVGRRILHISEDEAIGRPADEVLAGADAQGRPLADGTPERPATGRAQRRDGSWCEVSVVRSALRGGAGSVLVLRDVTREAQIERMKTEFLSNVSHELRTPLTPIRGFAEILRRRPDLPAAKTEEYAGSILDSALRLSRVVDLLVDVAALEAGRVVPEPVTVPVSDIVAATVQRWSVRAPGVAIRRRVERGLPAVVVDVGWMAKALDELVDNAVKYAGGPITVEATSVADRVRIAVRDRGPGIDADGQAALFADFEQVDGSATRSVGGLGLGLSFVRRVADDFGLGLGFTSSGRGSTFWLDLELARRDGDSKSGGSGRPASGARRRPAVAGRRS